MKKQIRTILMIVLITGVVTGSLVGCDNTDKDLEEARVNVIPAEIVTKTQDAVEGLQSYRADLHIETIQADETWINDEIFEYEYPDKLQTLGVSELNYPMIRIGSDEYFSMDHEYWHYTQSKLEYGLTDNSPAYNFVTAIGNLIGVESLEEEMIDGALCYHYKGQVDTDAAMDAEIAALDSESDLYDDQVKAIESQPRLEEQYELWIGKSDHILRKVIETQINSGTLDDIDQADRTVITWTFYDFNEDIDIVPPPADKVLIVELTYDAMSSIGGDDIEKQEIRYEITVGNIGTDIAESLRVIIDTEATNSGLRTIEATAEQGKVDLGPDQSVLFIAVWDLNMTDLSKEEVSDMLDETEIRAEWRAGFRSQSVVFQ